jgi:membrane fusion protein, multidrug efflux system
MVNQNNIVSERFDRQDAPDAPRPSLRPMGRDKARANEGQETEQKDQPGLLRRHPRLVALAAAALLFALIGGIIWLSVRDYESTDDAFIDARNLSVSPQVVGAIEKVPVTDNQLIQAGGLLVEIDPRDYEAAVAEAQAQVAQVNATIANLDAQIEAQNARIDQAEKQVVQTQAALTFAQQENDRAQDLVKRGAGTQQAAQQTNSNQTQAQATVASAQANLVAAQKQIPVLQAQRESAEAQLKQMEAALQHARTISSAPA